MIRLAAKVSPRAPEKSEPRRLKFLDEVPATDYQNSGFEPCRLRDFCITLIRLTTIVSRPTDVVSQIALAAATALKFTF